ncbi:MAG: SDR family NAD(P)-dependent oxidoreductase, partial [Planctomycetes bacterium]|nr:SDR family NAD(P)-dependent oxidoreductase [Planctomycetota bacterium]
MNDLAGKTALVCGSTRGIGLACAMELARRGAAVTLVARDEQALERARSELCTDAGQSHGHICVDFNDAADLKQKVTRHIDANGPVNILVNNTGGPPAGPIVEAEPEAFEEAFSKHLICFQILARATLGGMKESGYGRIVNIISTSVVQPIKGLGVSNTIRAAVANWAKTWATEVAPFGITVNNVLPGFTDTSRLQSLFKAKAQRTGLSPQQIERDAIA